MDGIAQSVTLMCCWLSFTDESSHYNSTSRWRELFETLPVLA